MVLLGTAARGGVVYLVEKGRLPAADLQKLHDAIADPSFGLAPVALDMAVVDALRQVSRYDAPDLPDRVIAATALALGLPLVTRDGRIRASGIQTIW